MSIRIIRKGARRKHDAEPEEHLADLEARAEVVLNGDGDIAEVGILRDYASKIEATSAAYAGNRERCVRLHKLAARFRRRADALVLAEAAKIRARQGA